MSKINEYLIPSEFYSQIINNLEDYAVLTMDNDLLINSWNTGAENIFQYTDVEMLGQHFSLIFTEQDVHDRIPFNEAEIAVKEGRAKDERWHIRKDGSTFYASGLVFPLKDKNGVLIGFIKILRNVTAVKESQDAIKQYTKDLKDLNAHKDKTLSVLSHDLRTPLSVIVGVSHMLKSGTDNLEDEDVKEMVSILHQSSKDMVNMLDNLLEWARVKYAADIFSPEDLNLKNFVNKAYNLNKERADSKAINLQNTIEENLLVYADRNMLKSILQNLVSNAVKYTGKNGEIIASAVRKDKMLVVSISDNGLGMTKEVQDKLFIPQLDALAEARKNKKEGAGIGLLLVKEFLDKIGGDIWVESQEGEGSTFYFTLPLVG
jgi:PAS domain S-box-containing protein